MQTNEKPIRGWCEHCGVHRGRLFNGELLCPGCEDEVRKERIKRRKEKAAQEAKAVQD